MENLNEIITEDLSFFSREAPDFSNFSQFREQSTRIDEILARSDASNRLTQTADHNFPLLIKIIEDDLSCFSRGSSDFSIFANFREQSARIDKILSKPTPNSRTVGVAYGSTRSRRTDENQTKEIEKIITSNARDNVYALLAYITGIVDKQPPFYEIDQHAALENYARMLPSVVTPLTRELIYAYLRAPFQGEPACHRGTECIGVFCRTGPKAVLCAMPMDNDPRGRDSPCVLCRLDEAVQMALNLVMNRGFTGMVEHLGPNGALVHESAIAVYPIVVTVLIGKGEFSAESCMFPEDARACAIPGPVLKLSLDYIYSTVDLQGHVRFGLSYPEGTGRVSPFFVQGPVVDSAVMLLEDSSVSSSNLTQVL